MRVLFVVALLCLALAEVELSPSRSANGKQLLRQSRYLRQRKPPPPRHNTRSLGDISTHMIKDQLLDHFDPTNTRTWSQRYFANPSMYAEDGPCFIFIEGESEAESGWIDEDGSYMAVLAKLYKANMYVLEHRYFGASKPTADLSTENLRWLSSDQALADLAYFVEYLIEKGEVKKDQKIVVFGGSYPGNLVAWARIKYPHLIHAGVASSAPVHAEVDFPEYMEVVTRSITKIGGEQCADNLRKAFSRLQKLAMTDDGLDKILHLFYMCDPLLTNNKLDMDIFYEILANPFAIATQYNRDDSYPEYSIKSQCEYMKGDLSDEEAISALADVFVAGQGGVIYGCVDWTFKGNTQSLSSTKYGQGDRQWMYLTCTMFGYFQTADGDTVFPQGYFDVNYFLEQCKMAFGENYNATMAQKGVKRSNLVFGDWTPDVDNVMFVNGEIDPWHSLSVLQDVNDLSPAVVISSTSHCYDMYTNDFGDSDELLAARARVKQFVHDVLYASANGQNPTLSP